MYITISYFPDAAIGVKKAKEVFFLDNDGVNNGDRYISRKKNYELLFPPILNRALVNTNFVIND